MCPTWEHTKVRYVDRASVAVEDKGGRGPGLAGDRVCEEEFWWTGGGMVEGGEKKADG